MQYVLTSGSCPGGSRSGASGSAVGVPLFALPCRILNGTLSGLRPAGGLPHAFRVLGERASAGRTLLQYAEAYELSSLTGVRTVARNPSSRSSEFSYEPFLRSCSPQKMTRVDLHCLCTNQCESIPSFVSRSESRRYYQSYFRRNGISKILEKE